MHPRYHSRIIGKCKFDFAAYLRYNAAVFKIAFSGLPACGKTAVLAEVKKILALKAPVAEVADICRSNPYDIDQKSGFVSQFFFMTNQVNEENIVAASNPEILLCDRSVLDQWVYWQKFRAAAPANGSLLEKEQLLEHLYRFWIKTYTLIFHIRADVKILRGRKTPNRFKNMGVQELMAMERLFLQTIQEDGLPALDIWNQGSVDEAAQQAVAEISSRNLI